MADMQPIIEPTEEWRDIPGYEGYYQVSNVGRIRSLDRLDALGRPWRGKVMSLNEFPSGYLQVHLSRDGKRVPKFAHRAVLEAFVGECPSEMETRHLNGNPSDNRLENLSWGTVSENNRDIVRHGKHNSARKTHCPQGHILSGKNLAARDHRKCLSCARSHAFIWRRQEFSPYFQEVSDIYYDAILKGEDTSLVINGRIDKKLPGVRSGLPARYAG